jgi:hypothetical protein
MCKKHKECPTIVMLKHQNLSFSHGAQKNPDNLCADIKYVDVHAKFYFRFFDTPIFFSFTQ